MRADYLTAKSQARFRALFAAGAFVSDARKMPVRWHVFTDGEEAVSLLELGGGKWEGGPPLTVEDTHKGDALLALADRIIRAKGLPGVGVILHVADEFATAPVRKEFSEPDAWDAAKLTIADSPGAVVDEQRLASGAAYRYVPLPGATSAVAVRLNSREKVFSTLAADTRIRLSVASAPLELLSVALPILPGEARDATVLLLVYSRFTCLATVDAKTKDLRSLVALPHNSATGGPNGVAARVGTELSVHGINLANVCIVDAGGDISRAVQTIVADFQSHGERLPVFRESVEIHAVARVDPSVFGLGAVDGSDTFYATLAKTAAVPPVEFFRPEFHGGALPSLGVIAASVATQNFASAANRADAARITRTEAIAFQASRAFRIAAVVGIFVAATAFGLHAFQTINSVAWNIDASQEKAAADKVADLTAMNTAATWWQKMLQPRSESVANMELLSQLFPEGNGATVKEAKYDFTALANETKETPRSVGYVRKWTIKGSYKDPVAISNLTNARVADAFSAAERTLGRALYSPGPTQQMSVAVSADRAEKSGTFTLNVEVTVKASDPSALPVGQALFPPASNIVP